MVFSSLEMQIRLIQTKVYYTLFHSVWKETSHKPLKVAAAKEVFPKSVYQKCAFSSWTQLLQGVPQRLLLGPMLFNIYVEDMFFALNETDVCKLVDDKTSGGFRGGRGGPLFFVQSLVFLRSLWRTTHCVNSS